MNLTRVFALLWCAFMTVAKAGEPPQKPVPAPFNPEQWTLVWSDEFDQKDGDLPDPAKWIYNVGGNGWGNQELQFYTEKRAENAFIRGGHLVIRAIKEKYKEREYTSARLLTKGKAEWTYGRFEIRARLPEGKGIWPAIWMLPSDKHYGGWPLAGEIDIMELVGHEPSRVHGTLHWGNPHVYKGQSIDLENGKKFSDDFHVFAVEWEPGAIRWYLDDKLFYTRTEWTTSAPDAKFPAPFDRPFHLILNVAVGGKWPGNPNATTEFPQEMVVDYVRVYTKKDAGAGQKAK